MKRSRMSLPIVVAIALLAVGGWALYEEQQQMQDVSRRLAKCNAHVQQVIARYHCDGQPPSDACERARQPTDLELHPESCRI